MAGAVVSFTPVGGGRSSTAQTGEDGSYELTYLRDIKGAKIGEHEVRITTFEEPVIEDDGSKSGGRQEEMPDEYLNGSVKRTVEDVDDNVIDFDVP